ncbi:MAG: DoxX family membrane protein [Myxococcales bacterium]|nr:DoxX family membrane protein [Myxococcales bacterium]
MKRLSGWIASPWVMLTLRLLLGALFLVAATPKILDPAAFALAVDNYHFLPTPLVNLWALVLPWTELSVGLLLVMGLGGARPVDQLTEAAALLSALMYLSFLIALSWALWQQLDIDCGCFNPRGADTITKAYLLRDGSLLIASVLVLLFHHRLEERKVTG